MTPPVGAADADLPPAARVLVRDAVAAVEAVLAQDPEALDEAAGRLGRSDPAHVRTVLGGVLRGLLEEVHDEGLSGDDVHQVLRDVLVASAWCPDVDPEVLVVLLAGALGVGAEDDDAPAAPSPTAVARHAALLLAELGGRTATPVGVRVRAAVGEVRRAEAHDG